MATRDEYGRPKCGGYVVLAYLQRTEGIGSIDEPKKFFAGEMPVRWGDFDDDQEDMIYFGGVAGSVVVGLAGSRSNGIGKPTGVTGGFSSNGPAIWSALEKAVRVGDSPNAAADEAVSDDETQRRAADIVATHSQTPARTARAAGIRSVASVRRSDGGWHAYGAGTPLYVSVRCVQGRTRSSRSGSSTELRAP